ncbi:glutamyl-tRNA synthetase [Neokomagataea thailandica NBRC 106555]|uniref:Glutamate--tRNA ligase n=2 Tax=Neokomagataea TaxID=1223423 RepID=A0A4Y6V6L1_9PROT|nr:MULTISPECIES: glutamate--tRNA ligase [Neokomagataea]QDH25024.1 glutamate--tRNA ligase [Neokomagataea tanensis]GBR51465.1 glutamyl-tRNA synthetase [Neokomagataea thailandica NBRC 106555]
MKLRFAPSPTGYLHVGNARQAVANYLYARRHGGRFILRMDDTDTSRSRPEYVDAIRRDLSWLGLEWDEEARQSDRGALYDAAIEKLKASGRLYPCFESEHELNAKREMRIRAGKPPLYDRAMLKLTADQRARAEANGKVPYWRFKLTDGSRKWNDLVMGECSVKLTAISDPVLIRADGTILYTLASVIDDLEMGITHIMRGEDHITNTGVQIDIAEAITGKTAPFTFAHLPLLLDTDGGKLSKRFDSLGLKSLRADGIEPMSIVSYLARVGTSDDPDVITLQEAIDSYDISHVSKSAARFDMRQLLALNRKALHNLPFEQAKAHLPAEATEEFWNAVRGNVDIAAEIPHWWDVTQGAIIPPSQPDDRDFLQKALETLPEDPWGETTWKDWTNILKEQTGRKGKALFMPLRLALTAEDSGPDLPTLLTLMGRERVLSRLHDAIRA